MVKIYQRVLGCSLTELMQGIVQYQTDCSREAMTFDLYPSIQVDDAGLVGY